MTKDQEDSAVQFQKQRLRFAGVTRFMGTNVRRYEYDGGPTICVSRDQDPDLQTDTLTVSVAVQKGSFPDKEWISGLLNIFGMRKDLAISPYVSELPFHTTYYYSQNLPRKDRSIRDCGGIKRLPLQ